MARKHFMDRRTPSLRGRSVRHVALQLALRIPDLLQAGDHQAAGAAARLQDLRQFLYTLTLGDVRQHLRWHKELPALNLNGIRSPRLVIEPLPGSQKDKRKDKPH